MGGQGTGLVHAGGGRPSWPEGVADLAWQQGRATPNPFLPPDRIHRSGGDLQQPKPQTPALKTQLAGRKSPVP